MLSRIFRPFLLLLALFAPARAADDFAIRDGDTVVFLGDSITAARTYGKIVEDYTLLRFPQRKVRFINAGQGGDTAAGGLKRLERDVFQRGATLLTVAYGINDIGWGMWANEEHKKTYLDSIRGIVEACKKRGVRVYICSAAVTGGDPNATENDFLQRMCDEGMTLSRSLGGNAIDVQRSMRAVQKNIWAANQKIADKSKRTTMHAADTIHLNDLGQLAMAVAILKGLGAPADVSAAVLDARNGKVLDARGCTISDVVAKGGSLEFTRLDEGLPLNRGVFWGFDFRWIPIPNELNRYMLTVNSLPKGRYEVTADGRGLGTFTSQQLAAGVNICSATAKGGEPGGPWFVQAELLQPITDARHEIAMSLRQANYYMAENPTAKSLGDRAAKVNEQLEEMQRSIAKPKPYRFVVRPKDE